MKKQKSNSKLKTKSNSKSNLSLKSDVEAESSLSCSSIRMTPTAYPDDVCPVTVRSELFPLKGPSAVGAKGRSVGQYIPGLYS